MSKKPPDPDMLTVHTYWDSPRGFLCPLCEQKISYVQNDGGRSVVTVKGKIWVVTNYYRCNNPDCDLHDSFPMLYDNVVYRKKFGKDVYERIIRYHFSYHMDYPTIQQMMWDEWRVKITLPSIMNICRFFEAAGLKYVNEATREDIRKSGKIILSLDGAQPRKGDPALWIFSDRLTGHVLLAVLLDIASAEVLKEKMTEIERKYHTPIAAVISDKQQNIVNAVKLFNPELPHAFCQYHFLNHIAEPIQSKDSHLALIIRKTVKKLSIVVNRKSGEFQPSHPEFNPLYHTLYPLAQELLNAVSVKGRKFEIFHGKEIYENLKYIISNLDAILAAFYQIKAVKSIEKIRNRLSNLILKHKTLYDEIIDLKKDFDELRGILDDTNHRGDFISKKTRTWVYKLQSRLKRRTMEYNANSIKSERMTHASPIECIWQQWIRLENSYHAGLYHTYDSEEIERTNNGKEQLIHQIKRHFRKWLGKSDIAQTFNLHGIQYSYLINLGKLNADMYDVLWADSVAVIEGYATSLDSLYVSPIRKWNIRESNTGNWKKLRMNLERAE